MVAGEQISSERKPEDDGDSFECESDSGATSFRLRRGSPCNPERRETLAKASFEPSCERVSSPTQNFLYKSCYYKGGTVYTCKPSRDDDEIPRCRRDNRD